MAPKSSVALDQWRGLAMLLVLVSHGFYASDRVNGIGRIGIQLFFVISGVLVHRSLARRRDEPRVLLALDFWWRRVRRLYPALLAYVVLMVPVTIVFEHAAPANYALEPGRYLRTVPSALVYATDYWPEDPPKSLGHLWSVACEMQFFLVAPLIFFLRNRFVWGALLAGLMLAGILQPVVDAAGSDKYHFEYAAWPLMLGFCCEHGRERLRRVPRRLTRIIFAGSVVVFGTGVLLPLLGSETKTLAIACGTFVVVACVIAYVNGFEIEGAPGRSLAWLGQRTYSIYLWQQPFTICAYLAPVLHPLGAMLSVAVGAVSFQLFERPFLTAGRRGAIVGRSATVAIAAALIAIPAAGAAPRDLIVFTRDERLFAIRADGSGLRPLSRAFEGAPAISADGRFVAAAVGGGVVIRTRGGRRVRRIRVRTGSEATQVSWSPGGRWIAFLAERCESGGRDVGPLCADLWLVSRNGRARRHLLEGGVSTSDILDGYSWSPDGRSIVFEHYERGGLAIVDVRTAKVHALPGTRRFGSRDPDWARTGWIAFARQRGPFRGSDLYIVRPNGRGLKKVCRAENAMRPVFSRDGRQLAFLDYRPTGSGNRWLVRVLRLPGRCRTIGVATEEWTLRWSPDGESLLWEEFVERLVIGRADGVGRPRFLTRGSTADWG